MKASDPRVSNYFTVSNFLILLIMIYLISCYYQLLHSFYIMDDFLCASFVKKIAEGLRPHVDFSPMKTTMGYYFYSLAFLLSDRTEVILVIMRHIALVYLLISLLFVYLISRNLTDSKLAGLWAAFWALTCNTLVEHGFSLRVDMLATMFALGALYKMISTPSKWRTVIAGLFLGLSFCSTQKAIYFIFAFIVSYWIAYRSSTKRPLKEFIILCLTCALPPLFYIIIQGRGGFHLRVIAELFFSSSVLNVAFNREYAGINLFYWQTFSRNTAFYCIAFTALILQCIRWRGASWCRRFLLVFTLMMLLFMGLHKAPWPYTFVMVIPFLAVFAGVISNEATLLCRTSSKQLIVSGTLLGLLLLVNSAMRFSEHMRLDLSQQMATVRLAEHLLGPNDTYFDGIWMVATRRHATQDILQKASLMEMIATWPQSGPRLMHELREEHCKAIILNYRIFNLPKEFKDFIREHFVLIGRNILVSGIETKQTSRSIEMLWPGNYRALINGKLLSLIIDGKQLAPIRQNIYLSAGKHLLEFKGSGTLQLLPEVALDWKIKHPNTIEVVDLFDNLYWK